MHSPIDAMRVVLVKALAPRGGPAGYRRPHNPSSAPGARHGDDAQAPNEKRWTNRGPSSANPELTESVLFARRYEEKNYFFFFAAFFFAFFFAAIGNTPSGEATRPGLPQGAKGDAIAGL
jgi:hypothetical protein